MLTIGRSPISYIRQLFRQHNTEQPTSTRSTVKSLESKIPEFTEDSFSVSQSTTSNQSHFDMFVGKMLDNHNTEKKLQNLDQLRDTIQNMLGWKLSEEIKQDERWKERAEVVAVEAATKGKARKIPTEQDAITRYKEARDASKDREAIQNVQEQLVRSTLSHLSQLNLVKKISNNRSEATKAEKERLSTEVIRVKKEIGEALSKHRDAIDRADESVREEINTYSKLLLQALENNLCISLKPLSHDDFQKANKIYQKWGRQYSALIDQHSV